ncbi:hypothetical protein PLESTM_000006800 [Pleodorina starrii]|nr:hypothetical protein PLESTM_000006800 [Pleodorina starrii]
MSEPQQQQQQQRVEQQQDPLGPLDRAHFAQELQELGLLEFAEEVNFSRLTEAPGDVGLASALARPGVGPSGPVGHNNPPPQPTQPIDIQQCHMKNQAAEVATAHAIQVLHLAKVSLHQLVNSYNPRAAGSGGTDGSSKRRKTSRGADVSGSRSGSKGLRHFSMKVCEKVEAKGRTTYNEVADELVGEMSKAEAANKNGQYDEKNIRRRVYDAINVLMAMDIIQKEKKEITWKGFPRLGNHSVEKLKADRLARIKEVEQKQLYLQDMIEQQKAMKKLLERSATRGANTTGTQLFLPFILVQAKPDATVEVKISEDMMDVQFDFYNSPFQIHDDSHVLKKMAEHQARQQQQQQQQQPFPNPLALHWPPPNGAAGMAAGLAAAAGLSPIPDPALAAQLAAAAAAQAQGNPLAYAYPAAAAAAYYQQHQQLLQQQHHHHQQHQQQQSDKQQMPAGQSAQPGQQQSGQGQQQSGQGQQSGQAGQAPSQQQQGQKQGQQQQEQQAQTQGQQSQQQQGQTQAQQQPPQQQAHAHQQQQQSAQTQQQQQGQTHAQRQTQQQQHLQQQQLQTLQALQALQHARATLPGLALPPLGAPLGPHAGSLSGGPSGSTAGGPSFGGPHHPASGPPQHLSQAPHLAGQLAACLPPGPGQLPPSLSFAGSLGTLPQHALTALPPTAAPHLLPLQHMPPAFAAVLAAAAPPQSAASGSAQPPAQAATAAGASAPAGGVGEVSGSMPALQHGMQMAGPGPATAFPLVA